MIDISTYLKQILDYVMIQQINTMNDEFTYQTEFLISEDFNNNLESIYNHLDDLYDKSRILQDMIAYAKYYIQNNIYDYAEQCTRLLKEIEENIDNTKEFNYTTEIVSFSSSNGNYTDRDGKILPQATVFNQTLTLSNKVENIVPIRSVSLKNSLIPYKTTIQDLLAGKGYHSFYILDNPVNNGLRESIYIELKDIQPVNQLDIKISNCEVETIDLYLENGTIENITNAQILHKTKKVKGILITLKCINYNTNTYYVDNNRKKYNFWDVVNESLYNKTIGKQGKTQSELDELAGLSYFKEDYERYTKNIESWLADRQSVVDQNRANGYSDSVPNIDFIVAPSNLNAYFNNEEIKSDIVCFNNYKVKTKSIIDSEKRSIGLELYDNKFYPSAENIKYQQKYLDYTTTEYKDKNNNIISIFRSDL